VIRRAKARRSARAQGAPKASSRGPPNSGATGVCSRKERSGAESATEQGPDDGERRGSASERGSQGPARGWGPKVEGTARQGVSGRPGTNLKGEPLPKKLLMNHVPGPRYFDVGRRADVREVAWGRILGGIPRSLGTLLLRRRPEG